MSEKKKLKKKQKKALGRIFFRVMVITFIIAALVIGRLIFA